MISIGTQMRGCCRQRKKDLAQELEEKAAALQQQVEAMGDVRKQRASLVERNLALQVCKSDGQLAYCQPSCVEMKTIAASDTLSCTHSRSQQQLERDCLTRWRAGVGLFWGDCFVKAIRLTPRTRDRAAKGGISRLSLHYPLVQGYCFSGYQT